LLFYVELHGQKKVGQHKRRVYTFYVEADSVEEAKSLVRENAVEEGLIQVDPHPHPTGVLPVGEYLSK
jgi:hypothetical protein